MTFYETCRQSAHLSLALLEALVRPPDPPPRGAADDDGQAEPDAPPRPTPVEPAYPQPAAFGRASGLCLTAI